LLNEDQKEKKEEEKVRHKAKRHAELKMKLGFKKSSKEEVDNVIEEFERKQKKYAEEESAVQQKHEPELATEIQGISKDQVYKSFLKEEDKFKWAASDI